MSLKPQCIPCSHTTAAGKSCKAWAMRDPSPDGQPPACAIHAGRARGGAPPANQNARTHGFYGRLLSQQEVVDVISHAADMSLDEEIACARVALRRVLEFVQQDAGELDPDQYIQVIKLIFYGTRTIGRLLSERSTLTSESAQQIADFVNQALDRMGEKWGRQL